MKEGVSSPPRADSADQLATLLTELRANGRLGELLESAARLDYRKAINQDILRGAANIAGYLYGESRFRRKVYKLVNAKQLPCFRLGGNICCRKSALLTWIAEQERLAMQPKQSRHSGGQ